MKKFLEDLKKELIKLNVKPGDIKEILDDHKEMIEAAQNEGVSDEEIVLKFGDPVKLAQELKEDSKDNTNLSNNGGENMNDFNLFQTYQVMEKEFDVTIGLVSEDITIELHELDQIEVFYKGVKDMDNYEISFDGNTFLLKRKSKVQILSWHKKSADFIVKMPLNVKNKVYSMHTVSGDAEVQGIHTIEFDIKTTSGDFDVNEFTAKKCKIASVSGDLELSNGKLEELTLSTVSGDVEMSNIDCSGSVDINTVSGDLEVENSYFGPTDFKSVSGDLEGKEFYPTSIQLKSVSGDIEITNSNKDKIVNVLRQKSVSGTVNIK